MSIGVIMKTQKNIFIAFVLNLAFSVFEIFGGIYTGSVAILSDSIHDLGDAISIGISYLLEKMSKNKPDNTHTFGYQRYSVLGSIFTTIVLIIGSVIVMCNATYRIFFPTPIKYDGMICFAIIGIIVNSLAAFLTSSKESLNQRAVNLHMLEDVLGWIVVLIAAIVMKGTNMYIVDPIMSVCVAVFILLNAVKHAKKSVDVLLEKIPTDITCDMIKENIEKLDGVVDVYHIHLWSLDGIYNCATLHVITRDDNGIKEQIRDELSKMKISHATIELEHPEAGYDRKHCDIVLSENRHQHLHHSH